MVYQHLLNLPKCQISSGSSGPMFFAPLAPMYLWFCRISITACELVDIEILSEGTLGVISETWILINVYIVKRTIS